MSLASIRAALGRRVLPLAIIAGVPFLFAACNQVGTAQLSFWDIIVSMIWFFFLFMAIMIWFQCFVDVFRRNDLSGAWKVIWILVMFWIPLFGCLIYMIVRPKMTAQDLEMATQASAAAKAATRARSRSPSTSPSRPSCSPSAFAGAHRRTDAGRFLRGPARVGASSGFVG